MVFFLMPYYFSKFIMKKILPLLVFPFLLLATISSAQGRGGHGGGGHHSGGGHSSGGGSHRTAGRSSFGGGNVSRGNNVQHSPSRNNTQQPMFRGGSFSNAPQRSTNRTTPPRSAQKVTQVTTIPGFRTPLRNTRIGGPRAIGTTTSAGYSNPYHGQDHWGYYHPYGYYGYYGYSPFYGYPNYYMWSFGTSFFYSPHYGYGGMGYGGGGYGGGSSDNNNYSENSNELEGFEMQGFVVYEHDTIPGIVTLEKNKVEIDNVDSGKHYDYSFKMKKAGLTYITVYESDSSNNQLNLVRLPGDKKNLWRVVHEGKLNIYDKRRGFLYAPDDVDMKSIKVEYNGQSEALYTHSVSDAKRKLTEYVNRAYGSNLEPNKFSWKELLIYIDKLD